jgi:hypothetical protein
MKLDRFGMLRVATGILRRVNAPADALTRRLERLKKAEARRRADAADLHRLEGYFGKVPPGLLKQAREYARDGLGSEDFAGEVAVYCAIARELREGWITKDYRWRHVMKPMAGGYWEIGDTKTLTDRILHDPASPDIGVFCNGLFLTRDMQPIPAGQAARHLFAEHPKIVFKTDSSVQGAGVTVLTAADFDEARIRAAGNGVFQRFVRQHEALEPLSPDAVATLRAITVLDGKGEVTLRATYLRCGRAGTTHVAPTTTMYVPVDLKNGRLGETGYEVNWRPSVTHPDTGAEFAAHQMPEYWAAIEACLRLHRAMPLVRSIGWDVTVDRDGRPVVLEWNIRHGVKVAEPLQGPCFADLGWHNLWRG